MMTNKLKHTLLTLLFLNVFYSFSQKSKGYYGRKFFFTSEVIAYSPLFYNLITKSYAVSKYDENLQYKNDWFNYGNRFSFGYIVKRNLSISLEAGIDHSDAYLPSHNTYFGADHRLIVPKAEVNTKNLMLKIELYSRKSLAPLGLSHQIGLGFSTSKMVDNNYKAKVSVYPTTILDPDEIFTSLSKSFLKNHYYNYNAALPFKMVNIVYAVIMKTTISKRIMLNYGFRYTFNIGLVKRGIVGNEDYLFQSNVVRSSIYNQQSTNFIRFNLGLTYVL